MQGVLELRRVGLRVPNAAPQQRQPPARRPEQNEGVTSPPRSRPPRQGTGQALFEHDSRQKLTEATADE